MPSSLRLLALLAVTCLTGCPPPWDSPAGCAEFDACTTTGTATTTSDALPTTSASDDAR